jgi:hypothetical protein
MDKRDGITISLEIENTYELYEDVTIAVHDEVIPAPPPQDDTKAYDSWAYDHIYPFTGVGYESGDSWYNVTVTACSDPTLVGRTFEWGY